MHNKEPWVIHKEPDSVECAVADEGSWFVAICCDAALRGESNADDNARRIVACVNACAGIPTELLEAGNGVADAVRHFQIQRDELLAALKEISQIANKMDGQDWDEIEAARIIANSAIAKATI